MATISTAKDKNDNREYSIQEIKDLKDQNPIKFEALKPNLVCYECNLPKMVARLGEINEHHFAAAANQKHQFDCYYFGDEYSQEEVENIVSESKNVSDNKPTENQIKRAFEQILEYLNQDDLSLSTTNKADTNDSRLIKQASSSGSSTQQIKSKYIPRKKLAKEIADEDIGVWKIYYGRVGIKYSKSNDNYDNFLVYALASEKTTSYRISLGILKSKLQECDSETQSTIEQIIKKRRKVNLMVLGKISKHNNYNNIAIFDANLLKISP